MHHLRSTWLSRIVVAVLVASMVPLLAFQMPERTYQADQHASWLRSQLSVQLEASAASAVDRALDMAAEESPGSLRGYTAAFATAYEQLVASSHAAADVLEADRLPSLSALFATTDVDAATLFSHLRYRAMQGTPPAVLPRFQATPSAPVPSDSPRVLGTSPAKHFPPVPCIDSADALFETPARVWSVLLRTLWSAQPLGP
ncbi:hypothetical protein CRI94_07650 [Longibacter salinarum]|uniref:Uncharacterized protein n=1 Tax=Longibacter salinarum TaxID=1850348 RepID=A0A2A8CZ88_9BACT|nr:hypothetical protein [Longibacter salinarum]PEN13921.1 hypothetical protein CRI94_07650 [Longibacter salinarum]